MNTHSIGTDVFFYYDKKIGKVLAYAGRAFGGVWTTYYYLIEYKSFWGPKRKWVHASDVYQYINSGEDNAVPNGGD